MAGKEAFTGKLCKQIAWAIIEDSRFSSTPGYIQITLHGERHSNPQSPRICNRPSQQLIHCPMFPFTWKDMALRWCTQQLKQATSACKTHSAPTLVSPPSPSQWKHATKLRLITSGCISTKKQESPLEHIQVCDVVMPFLVSFN